MPAYHLPRFNPFPRVESLEIGPRQFAYVIDDVLLNPDQVVDLAALYRDRLVRARGAHPELEWWMPPEFAGRLDDFFRLHVRRLLGGRRMLAMRCRLALHDSASRDPLPQPGSGHGIDEGPTPGECSAGSVLYLFRDASLGGTFFFRARRPRAEAVELAHGAPVAFGRAPAGRFGLDLASIWTADSGDALDCMGQVPARWNRAVFFDASVPHRHDLPPAERLSADPRSGRLTLEGHFRCVRAR